VGAPLVQLLEAVQTRKHTRVLIANSRLLCIRIRHVLVAFDDRFHGFPALGGQSRKSLSRHRRRLIYFLSFGGALRIRDVSPFAFSRQSVRLLRTRITCPGGR